MMTHPAALAAAREPWHFHLWSLAPAAALLALGGCALLRTPAPPPTTFYVLSATAEPGQVAAGRPLSLGLGPVSLPPYLDRPQMVSRVAENKLAFDEFNRWSEPLKENFVRALGNDLDRLIGIERLVNYPWYSTTKLDYAIEVTVVRFEPQPSGDTTLDARWAIRDAQGNQSLNRETHLSRPGGSPAEVAAALSGLVGDLAREIALALRELDATSRR